MDVAKAFDGLIYTIYLCVRNNGCSEVKNPLSTRVFY